MSNSNSSNEINPKSIMEKLESMEARISRIEAHIGYRTYREEDNQEKSIGLPETENSAIESNVVEYGLGWLSTIVFFFGIVFLMTYIKNIGYPVLAVIAGYAATACSFIFTYLLRKSFPHLVQVLNVSGLLLIFYITLRLHFFSTDPIINNTYVALLLMAIAIGAQVYYSIQKKSELLAFLSVLLVLLTAIFSDSTNLTLSIIVIAAGLSFYYFYKYSWWRQLIFSVFLVYSTHVIWLLSNPIMGHPMQAVESHQFNLLYLMAYGIIFSITILLSKKGQISDNVLASITIINALNFTFILSLVVAIFFKEDYVIIFGFIAIICLVFSIYLKSNTKRLFAPAFYASFGFMALSVCIYGFAKLPDSYYLLAIQSLVVVSMALWFRSKILVVVNTFLYIIIFLVYLFSSPPIDSINFVFAIVAFLTARILNWKKERLTLKTEVFRNMYLVLAFFAVLYGLNHALPTQYVTISWTSVAIVYLVLSILLKNIKYRWMAILTFLVTGGHLLLVDLANMDMGYRVLAFLIFAVISIGVTLYYSKKIKKGQSD